ncbi:MAG: hypothetical protein AABY01_03435, partial [Nanoarchaeota archaeon]
TPIASVLFNEAAQLVFSGYIKGLLTPNITATPSSGFNYAYTFGMPTPALVEGSYIFSVN